MSHTCVHLSMVGSRVVRGRSRVVRSRSIRLGRVGRGRGVLGLTRVLDVSNISTISIVNTVGHSLDPAVGKGHVVFTGSGIAVSGLVGAKLGPGVVVGNGVGIVVCWGHVSVGGSGGVGGRVVRGRRAGGGSNGSGHEGSNSNESL